jgi:hypothetical protein
MTTPASPTFQIPRDVIEPIIKAHVASAVIEALGGGTKLVEDAIMRILSEKVDSEGRPTNSDYNSTTWVLHAMRKALREEILATVSAELPKHREAIRGLIQRELRKSNSPLLKQFVDGMVGVLSDKDALSYRMTVQFETAEERRNRR